MVLVSTTIATPPPAPVLHLPADGDSVSYERVLRSRQKKLTIAAEDWTALEEVADMKAPLFVHGPEPINLQEEVFLVPGDQHAGVPRTQHLSFASRFRFFPSMIQQQWRWVG